jgi:iron complex outermembrane receptor protein
MMKGMRGAALLLGGVAAIAIGAPALAQNSTENAQGSGGSFASTDIVVTAQRRSERAQDVPIVITAFSPETLSRKNVTQPQDLYGTVPSLVSGAQGQGSRDVQTYSIRGQSTGFLASPGVQLYLNEVPLPSSISLNLQGAPGLFIDPENVQVLSGPQGTLFGRNTTGGAVLLQAKKPTNNFEGYIEGSLGNLNLRSVEGAINVPVVSEKLMVRVAGAYYDRRGFTRDLVWDKWRDDAHYYTGRIGIMFQPTERLNNYLLVYGTKSSNNGAGPIHQGFNLAALGCGGPSVPAFCAVYTRQTEIAKQIGPRAMRGDVDAFSDISSWGAINTTALELSDELTLRNIASYQTLKDNYAADQDGTPLQVFQLSQNARFPNFPIAGLADEFGLPATPGNVYNNATTGFNLPRDYLKQFTEELQLQGTMLDQHLTFAAGGFYYDAKPAGLWGSRSVQFCPAPLTGQVSGCVASDGRSGVSNRSKALYGQATFNFGALSPSLESLRLTAGYRYTWDRISGFSSSWATNPSTGAFTCSFGSPAGQTAPTGVDPAVFCNFSATLKSKAPTWTVGLDYRPMRDLLVYAKVSRGYKSGGFNTFAVRPETQTFAPEKLTTYEAGFKSDWRLGDVPVRLNATYYYSDYTGIQRPGGDFVFITLPDGSVTGAGGAAIFSAEATIQGVELEASIRPHPDVEIGGSMSYAHGKYKSYDTISFGGSYCNGSVPFGGVADFRCAPFQFLVPWIYNIYGNFKLPIPENVAKSTLYINYSHVAGQYSAPGPFEPGADLEANGRLSASLKFAEIRGTGLDLTIFGNNLLDKVYRISNTNSFGSGSVASLYGEPRTYGVKLRYRFGSR